MTWRKKWRSLSFSVVCQCPVFWRIIDIEKTTLESLLRWYLMVFICKIKFLQKIANGFRLWPIFGQKLHLDVWQSSRYVCFRYLIKKQILMTVLYQFIYFFQIIPLACPLISFQIRRLTIGKNILIVKL